jgi:uncharacterized protein YjiS (DUF1127 family)
LAESGHLFGWLRRRLERRRQGFALARLSDLALRDIGLNRLDVEVEADELRWNPLACSDPGEPGG